MLFFRTNTDWKNTDCTPALESSAPGSAAWILGAGPSLKNLDETEIKLISNSPAAKIAINHAGRGEDGQWIVKPTHWTSYDSTDRFSRAVINDPSIMKFLPSSRLKNVILGEQQKLCDCPNTFFFEKETRPYERFLDPRSNKILDCQDSLVQAIDIAFRLGYRKLYFIGTEMRISFSEAQLDWLNRKGLQVRADGLVQITDGRWTDRWDDVVKHFTGNINVSQRLTKTEVLKGLSEAGREDQYCFGERKKNIQDAVTCDTHYWQRVQYLRLAKRSLLLNGVEAESCTPNSRLNSVFLRSPLTVAQAAEEIGNRYGKLEESLIGCYTAIPHTRDRPHTDIKAFEWPKEPAAPAPPPEPKPEANHERNEALMALAQKEIDVD